MVAVISWLIAAALAIERLVHYRSRGTGSRWFGFAFIVCSIAVTTVLVGTPSASLMIRAIAGAVAVLTGVTGGMYSAPLVESKPSTTSQQLRNPTA